MRGQDEIVKHIKERMSSDIFGFEVGDLYIQLDFEHAKEFLKEGTTQKVWDEDRMSSTDNVIIEDMKRYMVFAWEKANDCRGLSANRSIMHYLGWTWLVNDDLYQRIKKEWDTNYQHYGKDILQMICEEYNWDWKQWDNGKRVNSEDE